MRFCSEGDIVYASNSAQSLTNLVIAYLTLYQQYANGLGGVTVPTEPYTVVFLPMVGERALHVKLVHTVTRSHSEPVYYDVDDDDFNESWGASNVSHHVTVFSHQLEEKVLTIPFEALLCSRENMRQDIQRFAETEKKRLQEVERQSKIAAHQEAIRKLQEENP
jgi:hypothetical protein